MLYSSPPISLNPERLLALYVALVQPPAATAVEPAVLQQEDATASRSVANLSRMRSGHATWASDLPQVGEGGGFGSVDAR